LVYRNNGTVSDDAGIQAIIKYKDGSTGTEDWSQVTQQDVPFCTIEELVLVLSNASITPSDSKLFALTFSPPASGPHASVSPRAANVCTPNPQGNFSGTAHYDDTVSTSMDWSWSGNVDFDPDGQINPWFPGYDDEVWDNARVASGSVTVSGSGTVYAADPVCTVDIPSQSFQLGPENGTMIIQPGAEPLYGIDISGPPIVDGTITCPDDDPYTGGFPAPAFIYTPDPEQAAARGNYQGSGSFSNEFFVANYNWNLVDP
jgi:hypothetical protein